MKKINLDSGMPRHETLKRAVSEAVKQFLARNNSSDPNIVGELKVYFNKNKQLCIWIPGNGVPGQEACCPDITKEYLDNMSKHGD